MADLIQARQTRANIRKQIAFELFRLLSMNTWLETALIETLAQKFGGYQMLTKTVLLRGEWLGLFERETNRHGDNTGRWQLGPLGVTCG